MKRERDFYKRATYGLEEALELRDGKVKLQYKELLELRAFKKSKVLCAKCGESYPRDAEVGCSKCLKGSGDVLEARREKLQSDERQDSVRALVDYIREMTDMT